MDAAKKVNYQQSLCLSCGLCCDGTLFGKVTVKPDDILPPLEAAGIQIQRKETKKSFKQPCVAYQKSCCQVYAERPTNCRKYRCELLKKYEGGDVSFEEAQQKINRAQQLKNLLHTEISCIMPDENQLSIPAILRVLPEQQELSANPVLLKKWGKAMLNFSALLDYLQTNFQPPREVKDSTEKPEK